MLRLRIFTGVTLGCLLLAGLFLLPSRFTVLALAAVACIGAWEWAAFGGMTGGVQRLAYSAATAALLWLAWVWSHDAAHLVLLLGAACCWWIAAFAWLVLGPQKHSRGLTLLCGVFVLVPAFVALERLDTVNRGFTRGPDLILVLILLVIASDIGAFFAGRAFGRRRLAPRVSPGKTWEGALGGMMAVAAVALLGAMHFDLPVLPSIGFGCAVGVFSVVGDLTESMFKRAAGLKDSGALLPGHGGLLDRLDSITAAAPLYALGLFGSGVIA
jgi:phosphatidate cytidylyltransferase